MGLMITVIPKWKLKNAQENCIEQIFSICQMSFNQKSFNKSERLLCGCQWQGREFNISGKLKFRNKIQICFRHNLLRVFFLARNWFSNTQTWTWQIAKTEDFGAYILFHYAWWVSVFPFQLFYFLEFDLRFCGHFVHFLLRSFQINNFASRTRSAEIVTCTFKTRGAYRTLICHCASS